MSINPTANSPINQLIDANLDRAREGLRVVEDWCRYGLNQKDLVVTLKDWRQQLGRQHYFIYKQARATAKDAGIGLDHPVQENRHSPEKIVEANCSRAQEALRALEEYSRSTHPTLAKVACKIRYELYDLELKVLKATNKTKRLEKLKASKICLITSPKKNLLTTLEKALSAGVKMVQYRSKDGTDHEKLLQAKGIAALCRKHEALFIINDRIDLAIAVDADGVHLGQHDFPIEVARNILGSEKIIGKSTHSLEQIQSAQNESCDYLGVGPMYSTKTKPNETPLGIKFMSDASKELQIPWFAIGGINNTNLNEVIATGVKRIALVGAIMNSKEPFQETLDLIKKLS